MGPVCRWLCLFAVAAVLSLTGPFHAVPAVAAAMHVDLLQGDEEEPPEPPEDSTVTPGDDEQFEPPALETETPDDATEEPEAAGSIDGNTYTDEEYGWSLTWDESWAPTSDPTEDGYLGLNNGVSSVFIYSLFMSLDARSCIREEVGFLVDGDAVSSVSRLTQSGEVVRGGDADAAFAAYRYNFKTETATVKMVAYYDCRLLPNGGAVLVYQIVTQDAYADEAEGTQDLLNGLTIEEDASTPTPDETATPDPDDSSGNASSNQYTNPTYDYSISWDDSWTREDGVSEDDLELTNGPSDVSLMPFPNGNAEGCVLGNITLQGLLYSDLEQATGNNDQPLEGGDANNYYAVYVATDTDGNDEIIYFECYSLDSENSLLIQHKTAADDYNDQIDARLALLENLELPE